MSTNQPRSPRAVSAYQEADILVVAARERTVLLSGLLAGLCVFFAPLAVLAVGLLATYLASVVGEGSSVLLGADRSLQRADFQAVFAPAINEAPLLVSAGLVGAVLAQFRRWLYAHQDPADIIRGRRPYFRELTFLYAALVALILGLAAVRGGWVQVDRLLHAAPAFFLLMLCATWLAHAVWSYCFRNIIELLASGAERAAAAALFEGRRRLGHRSSHA
ncbi:MAG TPA: hypothetical protein VH257_12430 [Chloroflexota bacterium]|nr:hypothetical protein [Chloroflexota bacterium]